MRIFGDDKMRSHKLCPVHSKRTVNASSNCSLKSLFSKILESLCTCVYTWAFECVHKCVCVCVFAHVDGKSRDMSTVKSPWACKETTSLPVTQHISTTKDRRRNFFGGHTPCLREQSNSYHSLLLSPSHSSSERSQRPFSPKVSGNSKGPNFVFASPKLK